MGIEVFNRGQTPTFKNLKERSPHQKIQGERFVQLIAGHRAGQWIAGFKAGTQQAGQLHPEIHRFTTMGAQEHQAMGFRCIRPAYAEFVI